MTGTPIWTPELELHHAMLRGATLEEMIEAGLAGGYGSLVLGPLHYGRARAAGRSPADMRAMLADAGLVVHYIDGYPSGLPGAGKVSTEFLGEDLTEDRIFATMEAFDAKAINVPHYMGTPLPQAVLRDALIGLCDRARAHGRSILIEFQPESGVPSFTAAVALAEASGADNAMATLDTVQLAHAGGGPEQLTPQTAARLGAFQLSDKKNPIRPGRILEADRYRRALPGEGDLPLHDMLRRLRALKPAMPIGVEIFSEALQALPHREAAIRAAEATRRVLAEL